MTEPADLDAAVQALQFQTHCSGQKVTYQADRKQADEVLHDYTTSTQIDNLRGYRAIKYSSTTIADVNISFYCCHHLSQLSYSHILIN